MLSTLSVTLRPLLEFVSWRLLLPTRLRSLAPSSTSSRRGARNLNRLTYNWVGELLAFAHLTPQPSIAQLSTWTLTANIGPGFTIGLIPMALLRNPSPYSTSTPRGRCASLTHARYVTTLTTISLSAPFPMSGLEVSRWLVLS